MGLASSQARLLNLTSRMHQIEYKAAKLEAEKLQMANESRKVYLDYQNALEATKIQVRSINSDASTTYIDIQTYEDFLNAGFALYYTTKDGRKKSFDGMEPITIKDMVKAINDYRDGKITREEFDEIRQKYMDSVLGSGEIITIYKPLESFNNLCKEILGVEDTSGLDVQEVITNLIKEGMVLIVQKDPKTGEFPKPEDEHFSDFITSVATNTGLQEVSDEKELRKAEAKYEADMRRIDYKDRKFDYDLAALDAERNAIKNEMETLKTVAKDNVERTFRLFS